MEIKNMAILANTILEKNTGYSGNKSSIQKVFTTNGSIEYSRNDIVIQLIVIDSCYSTNFNKRYFGFEELADEILEIGKTKTELKSAFINFASNPTKSNLEIFQLKFGYNKTMFCSDKNLKSREKGLTLEKRYKKFDVPVKNSKAKSLISKYAYFVTDFEFPIFDSIAEDVIKTDFKGVLKEMKLYKNVFANEMQHFVSKIKAIMEFTGIESYNVLDNYLWLVGKIRKGNFSLILSKMEYIELTENIDWVYYYRLQKVAKSNISFSKEKAIRDFVIECIKKPSNYIFNKNQEIFIRHALKILN